jgi:hypothetical protein
MTELHNRCETQPFILLFEELQVCYPVVSPLPAVSCWKVSHRHTPHLHQPTCGAWQWHHQGSRGCSTGPGAPAGQKNASSRPCTLRFKYNSLHLDVIGLENCPMTHCSERASRVLDNVSEHSHALLRGVTAVQRMRCVLTLMPAGGSL